MKSKLAELTDSDFIARRPHVVVMLTDMLTDDRQKKPFISSKLLSLTVICCVVILCTFVYVDFRQEFTLFVSNLPWTSVSAPAHRTRNEVRLDRFKDLLAQRVGLVIGMTGGSVSAGHSLKGNDLAQRENVWGALIVNWLNVNFPVDVHSAANIAYRNLSRHILWNRARPASTSFYASVCNEHLFLEAKLQEEDAQIGQQRSHMPDLLLIDFSVNDWDFDVSRLIQQNYSDWQVRLDLDPGHSMERMVRIPLANDDFPTALFGIILERTTPAGESQPKHAPVFDHYGVPSILFKDEVREHPVVANGKHQASIIKDLYNDPVHLSGQGHAVVGELIMRKLQLVKSKKLFLNNDELVKSYLPDYMYSENHWLDKLQLDSWNPVCQRLTVPYKARPPPFDWTVSAYSNFSIVKVNTLWRLSDGDFHKRRYIWDHTKIDARVSQEFSFVLDSPVRYYFALLVMTDQRNPGTASIWLSSSNSNATTPPVLVTASSSKYNIDVLVPIWDSRTDDVTDTYNIVHISAVKPKLFEVMGYYSI